CESSNRGTRSSFAASWLMSRTGTMILNLLFRAIVLVNLQLCNRGVASVALRSLAVAAECLTTRREQEEVLRIFDKIRQETGWRIGFVIQELRKKWAWPDSPPQQQQQQQPTQLQPQQVSSVPPSHTQMQATYPQQTQALLQPLSQAI